MATRLADIVAKHRDSLLAEWVQEQKTALGRKLVRQEELVEQSKAFLQTLEKALAAGGTDTSRPEWEEVRQILTSLSRERGQAGYTATETATFVFSFKQSLFRRLTAEVPPAEAPQEMWNASTLLDALGLFTTEMYQRTREELIARQEQEMLELSTPVVSLWDGVLALPMIGTLDSARTQVVMETLLQRIVETGSAVAILDITGVPTVDTLVAQHLLKTVAAGRLMGAECIISGIRPQIAQTIVHLGVDLGSVVTKGSLADAFALALQKTGRAVTRVAKVEGKKPADKPKAAERDAG